MFNPFAALGRIRAYFFKSEQYQLIEMPVQVGASVDKHGHTRKPHVSIRKVRVEQPPVQHSLFGGDDDLPKKPKKATRLDTFIRKHGGLGNLAHHIGQMTDAERQRIYTEMGKLGGKTPTEVSLMFRGVKPVSAVQEDLFAGPAVKDSLTVAKPGTVTEPDNKVEAKKQAAELKEYKEGAPAVAAAKPEFDVSARTEQQLRYLSASGKPGWKEAAIAELAKRNPDTAPKEGDHKTEAGVDSETDRVTASGKTIAATVPETNIAEQPWDRNDAEIDNLRKISAINKRQNLGVDVEGMASETLRNSGRLGEVFDAPELGTTNPEPFGIAAGITKAQRIILNNQAVAIVNRGGPFSDADKAILRQYSGNGGCGDSLNEFYTLPEVASAMWSVAQKLGVKGDVLEPSCGTGVFLHTASAGAHVTGVEMSETSAKIAKALHGERHEVANASLERFATQDARQFDAVLGNVPFGPRGSTIRDDKPHLKTAEAYFFDTALDKCKAGGIVGLVVPTGVMDSSTNRNLREGLLRKGQFLGAQRMPNTAFEHSHTGVTTDVVWFRKYPDDVAGALSSKAVSQDHLKSLGVWDEELLAGDYFVGRGAPNVLGTMADGWRAKAGIGADITVEGSMDGVPEAMAEFSPETDKPVPAVTDILAAVGADEKARATVLGGAMARPYADTSKVGDTKVVDGVAYVLQGHPPRWHRVDEVLQSEALTQGQDIARRIDTLMDGGFVDRPQLEQDVRAWVDAHGLPVKHKDIQLGVLQDKTLHRLIGAVNSNGDLSDLVRGKVVQQAQGSFEVAIQSMLNDHETVGVKKLSAAAGIDEESALDQLYGSNKYAFDAATGEWTTKDIYLSGNLWEKSDAVKAALAGEGLPPEQRTKLEQQAVMLNDAIAPVSLEDAFVELNSAFVPTSVMSAFLTWRNKEGPNANKWTKDLDPVEVTFADGVYVITGGNEAGGLSRLDKYLNRTGLRKDDKHIIDALNVEYKDWLCASPEYREKVEELYNRNFKGFAVRTFSNEPMDIPGLNAEGLKAYQWGGIRWALNAGKGIIADDVGLGKTAKSLILAKALKTSGQAKRPMIVAPKSVLSNWVAECEKWFPGSKVLVIGAKGDNAAERKRKYHDLQQNDYDFILVSEPSFEELDLDPATKKGYEDQDFWAQRGESLKDAKEKKQNKVKTGWEQNRAEQDFSEKDRTDATYFNEMGIDCIIADEAHHQKNLVSIRSRFGMQPKYLGGGALSKRALDFNLKSRWLLENNNHKNVYLCTATPTKNSVIEMYAMLSHVAPEAFEKIGIRNSEEFLDRFAKFEEGMAQNTGGTMEEALITTGFKNVDELRTIMGQYIWRRTAEDVGLELPQRHDVQHLIDMDAEQEAAYIDLREKAAASKDGDATGDAHIFSIMDKMNKTATDLSLVDDSYDGTKSPKYVACAKEIVQNVKDGGQIVFSDYVDAHEKIAAALVKSGIPRSQIGIINAKAASSSEARQKICDAFNAGKLKVVIGNTATMGEGLNLQKGTSDIHHLDLPWEPASMQQRNGRGLRQGNKNKGVRIHQYLAKGSFDGYRLQAILAKKDWQDAIWKGGNELENLNKRDSINREELAIMLSADPDQAREAYENNRAEKEARLTAGKTADAAERFVKLQETKRSYNALTNKDTQSAARLKAKMDKEASSLRADRHFQHKQALDMDTPVIVAKTGALLHSGAGIDVADGDKKARYVITSVDQRSQEVTMRKYGEPEGFTKTVSAKDLRNPVAFEYNEADEKEVMNKVLAERPADIKSVSDVFKLPAVAVEANYDKLQKQIWEGLKSYHISSSDNNVVLVNKTTGELEYVNGYSIGGKGGTYNADNYDILLPTEENKAKVEKAWMDAERDSILSMESVSVGNRRNAKSNTVAKRKYGSMDYKNPWSRTLEQIHGGSYSGYGYDVESPRVKAARATLHAEAYDRVRHAKTFQQAMNEAAAVGEIIDSEKGYSARVKLPKKVIAALWAKAKHQGILSSGIKEHSPTRQIGEKFFPKHHGYYDGAYGDNKIHAQLLKIAVNSGHDDLVHAMVESGLRHGVAGSKESLIELAKGYGHTPDRIKAMQKLAEDAGMMDKKRKDISGFGLLDAGHYSYGTDGETTIRDRLAELLAESKKIHNKETA